MLRRPCSNDCVTNGLKMNKRNPERRVTTQRYQILSIGFKQILAANFDLYMSDEEERLYCIEHDDSLFDDQLKQMVGEEFIYRGYGITYIPHVILVEAKKNPKKTAEITRLIKDGFRYNGVLYKRFGKSASQAKAGITLFVSEDVYDRIMESSMLGLPPSKCVISKYEAQRCLILSTCTLVRAPLPHIIIIDEFEKAMPHEYIRYVVNEEREFTDEETGKQKTYNARVVKEGFHDLKLSPFDGCGCHSHEMSKLWSSFIGLDYDAIGFQIRLPFFKGYSVEVPFKEYYKEIGIEYITDVFGNQHRVEDIDCIWNKSMFKALKTFQTEFGAEGWNEYIRRLEHYGYKIGISKYSHHKKDIALRARFNFQYLQCLDLDNQKFIDYFDSDFTERFDLLDKENWGKVEQVASYTTGLFEKIIKGDKLYTLKFLGVDDTTRSDANSKYVEAALINDAMLKDPCIQRYLYRKLKIKIDQAKLGKIYASGFYHTVVGDMIAYLEYAAGLAPNGCLGATEFFCKTLPAGDILSLRSPLVCPSEVNDVRIVTNPVLEKWFSHFQDQDVVMINMYDLSMPRQGGMTLNLCPSFER